MITHVSYREATFQGESQVADGMKQWTDLGWRVSKVERVSGRRFVVRFRYDSDYPLETPLPIPQIEPRTAGAPPKRLLPGAAPVAHLRRIFRRLGAARRALPHPSAGHGAPAGLTIRIRHQTPRQGSR